MYKLAAFIFLLFSGLAHAQPLSEDLCRKGWLCEKKLEKNKHKTSQESAQRLEKLCGEEKVWACAALGFVYLEGSLGQMKDLEKALGLFRRACQAGNLWGCNNLGYMYTVGEGTQKDQKKAAGLFKKACQAGYLEACASYGDVLEHGLGVPKNARAALAQYQKACAGGYYESCTSLGAMYAKGPDGIELNLAKAADLYQKACDNHGYLGCSYLGASFLAGLGRPKDPKKALPYLRLACKEKQMTACYALGGMYFRGVGVAKNLRHADSLLWKACRGNSEDACILLVTLMREGRVEGEDKKCTREHISDSMKRGCDQGDALTCWRAGSMYLNGWAVPVDLKLAAFYLKKACDLGTQKACEELAGMMKSSKQEPEKPRQ